MTVLRNQMRNLVEIVKPGLIRDLAKWTPPILRLTAQFMSLTLCHPEACLRRDIVSRVQPIQLSQIADALHVIQPGDRIAQPVIAPVVEAELEEAASLDDTTRGAGGFGHTG